MTLVKQFPIDECPFNMRSQKILGRFRRETRTNIQILTIWDSNLTVIPSLDIKKIVYMWSFLKTQ